MSHPPACAGKFSSNSMSQLQLLNSSDESVQLLSHCHMISPHKLMFELLPAELAVTVCIHSHQKIAVVNLIASVFLHLLHGDTQLFQFDGSGAVSINIDQTYPLAETVQAHKDLEGRSTTGSTVLIP